MAKFDREWLMREASMYSGDKHDAQMAAALALALKVVDAVMDDGTCRLCDPVYDFPDNYHNDDCPVKSAIDAGLVRKVK